MAARTVDPVYLNFAIVTPKLTPIAAPLSTTLAVVHGTLEEVDVTIPPGHAGRTGLQLQLARQVILPWGGTSQWLIGDDVQHSFPIGVEVDTQLIAVTYNTGNYDHQHLLRVRIKHGVNVAPPAPVQLVPVSTLNGSN